MKSNSPPASDNNHDARTQEEELDNPAPLPVLPDDESLEELAEQFRAHPEMLEDPKAFRQAISMVRMEASMWSGPQASPETMREYNELVPGVAQRLWNDFFAESEHRRRNESLFHETQSKLALAESGRQDKGLWVSSALILIAFSFAAFVSWLGYQWVAIAMLGIPLTVLLLAILSGGNLYVLSRLADRMQRTDTDPEQQ